MKRNIFITLFIVLSAALSFNCKPIYQKTDTALYKDSVNGSDKESDVSVAGAMKDVMWKGELAGIIDLDTISNRKGLYGLGPVEYLSGELLIIDGKTYKSKVLTETSMKVEELNKVKAPFFVYANIDKWKEQNLPDSIQTIPEFELYIELITKNAKRPFAFKLTGSVESATIHIVNLPEGSKVSSPEEAHKGQTNYNLKNSEVEIIGFFSTEHKGIFTHHDSNLHLHLITKDKTQMGHLDNVKFDTGEMKLYLPEE